MKKILTLLLFALSIYAFCANNIPIRSYTKKDIDWIKYKRFKKNYFIDNWTLTGAKVREGNGLAFSSKSIAQLSAFNGTGDSILFQVSRTLQRPVFRYNVADTFSTIAYLGDITSGTVANAGNADSLGHLAAIEYELSYQKQGGNGIVLIPTTLPIRNILWKLSNINPIALTGTGTIAVSAAIQATDLTATGHVATVGLTVTGGAQISAPLTVTGSITNTSLTGTLIKTNSGGQQVAAIAGVDYATPGSISSDEVFTRTGAIITAISPGTNFTLTGTVQAANVTVAGNITTNTLDASGNLTAKTGFFATTGSGNVVSGSNTDILGSGTFLRGGSNRDKSPLNVWGYNGDSIINATLGGIYLFKNVVLSGGLSTTGNISAGGITVSGEIKSASISTTTVRSVSVISSTVTIDPTYPFNQDGIVLLGFPTSGQINTIGSNTGTNRLTYDQTPSRLNVTNLAVTGTITTNGLSVAGIITAAGITTTGSATIAGNLAVTGGISTGTSLSMNFGANINMGNPSGNSSISIVNQGTSGLSAMVYSNGLTTTTHSMVGTLSTTQLSVASGVSVTGAISANTLSASVTILTNNFSSTGLAQFNNLQASGSIAGLLSSPNQSNISTVGILTGLLTSGNISATGNITGTNLAGTLTTAVQPNITSLGTLTNLTVTGFINAASWNNDLFVNGGSVVIPNAQFYYSRNTSGTLRTMLTYDGSNNVVLGNSGASITIAPTTQVATFAAPPILPGYTVATLPTGTIGMHAYVTDALAPGFLTIVVGGGTIKTPVFYNGTNWVAF